jgi:transposase InsO family protein
VALVGVRLLLASVHELDAITLVLNGAWNFTRLPAAVLTFLFGCRLLSNNSNVIAPVEGRNQGSHSISRKTAHREIVPLRTDNGVPFASAHALYDLSKLSGWWLRLGIHLERIQPGHPQQNGRHERMQLSLKTEATKPAAANVLQQQPRFDTFLERYNHGRPHQALGMKVPADLYARSPRVYRAALMSSPTPFTTTRSPSPAVVGSASNAAK